MSFWKNYKQLDLPHKLMGIFIVVGLAYVIFMARLIIWMIWY